jgi:hypothetical protein
MKLTSWVFAASLLPFTLALGTAERLDPLKGTVDPSGGEVWYDGRLLLLEGRGWENTESYYDRLPASAKDKVRAPVWDLSHDSAGMCLRFVTEATSVKIRWTLRKENLAMPHMPATGVSGIDLYVRAHNRPWMFVQNGRPSALSNEASFPVTPGVECLLYLPLYNGVKSIEIGIHKDKAISKPIPSPEKQNRPIVFYGTSITQGGCASRPGMACTALVRRQLDMPVINLGFSGNGKMEAEMADLLAELDPAVYVLDCLWNMRLQEGGAICQEAPCRPAQHADPSGGRLQHRQCHAYREGRNSPSDIWRTEGRGNRGPPFLVQSRHAWDRWRRHRRRLPP